jgi:hypothetical protein
VPIQRITAKGIVVSPIIFTTGLTIIQQGHRRRLRAHGSASPKILLPAKHVPLRLYALPVSNPQPHLRDGVSPFFPPPPSQKFPTNSLTLQILETLKLETKLKQYEGDTKAQGKDGAKLEQAGGAAEIGNLKKKLEQKDRDLENLKKQAEGLNREYRELSDKYAATQPSGGPKKDR